MEAGGLEPHVEFEHLLTEGEMVTLRVHLSYRLAPTWLNQEGHTFEGLALTFTMPRSHVARAAASLQSQLQRFPPRCGAETRPPFTGRELSPRFFIDWLLVVPGATGEEATATAIEYMRWLRLEPVVRACSPSPDGAELWLVRLVTDLLVPRDDPFRALFQMLSHLPMPYGGPHIHRPYLWPDGHFTCRGELAPAHEDPDDHFSRVRGHFELANHEDEQRFWYVMSAGARPPRPDRTAPGA